MHLFVSFTFPANETCASFAELFSSGLVSVRGIKLQSLGERGPVKTNNSFLVQTMGCLGSHSVLPSFYEVWEFVSPGLWML